MTYEEFVKKYESLLTDMFSYTPNEVGSLYFAERLADLVDAYPHYMDQYDSQF